jgi:hypothetical protein
MAAAAWANQVSGFIFARLPEENAHVTSGGGTP